MKTKIFLMACLFPFCSWAKSTEQEDINKFQPLSGLEYSLSCQGSFSSGKTPLWLNANKYGLSSLEEKNGYLRGSLIRGLKTDSIRKYGIGYGVDIVKPYHYTSKFIIQQAFVEARWLHGVLGIGAKEYPMELKNNSLSSGSQTLGVNARPVPQVRLSLPDYWTIPILGRWLHLKGHLAYGKMTDNDWQHDFTHKQSKYADNVLFHSKAAYLMIGNPERFYPFSLEIGLEMASTFGGKSHLFTNNGDMVIVKNSKGLKSFINALFPSGSDKPEKGTTYQNNEGDVLGSWMIRANYDSDLWKLGLYVDKFFEDHSSMFQLDYDGYGEGDDWNVKKHTHFFRYDLKDWMLGVDLQLKYNRWISNFVFEYLYTKYQSGPIYHDHSVGRSDHISGRDDFYNHYIFTGWQHWGQAIGNPLYRSPLYNEDGRISFQNNRFIAYHLGLGGHPWEKFRYRVLATYLKGWGTYDDPFLKKHHQVNFMLEGTYNFPRQWSLRASYGMDFGKILGSNSGFQLTISKFGILKK